MARSAFEEVIRLQLDRFSPEKARELHIRIARQGLVRELAGMSEKPDVSIETDGHPASSEESVKPFGVIVYRFIRMREIAAFAMKTARQESPVRSGRYRDSWFLMVDNAEIDMDKVAGAVTVTLTNDQPYTRKIMTGAKGFERYVVDGSVCERVRQRVLVKYRAVVDVQIRFLHLSGGMGVPYILKKGLRHIKEGRRYGGIRRDAQAGMEITYPSVVLTPKFRGLA